MDQAKLSRFSAMWVKAVSIVPSFSNVPDGQYVADLKEMKLEEAKKSGRLQVVTTYEIVEGEFTGKTCKRFDGVEDETGLGYFKHMTQVKGLDLPDYMGEWQEKFDTFIGDPLRIDLYDITVKSSKGKEGQDYTNVYLNQVSDYTKSTEEEVAGEAGDLVEEVPEEIVEEVVDIVEELPQQVEVPTKRAAPKPLARPVAAVKAVAQPVRKVAAAPAPAARVAPKLTSVPAVRKIVSLRK